MNRFGQRRFRGGRARARGGFTAIEVLLVAGAVIVMACLGVAGLNRQRVTSAGLNCATNLRLVQEAKRAALEEDPTLTSFTEAQLVRFLPDNRMPTCPGHGTYSNQLSLGATAVCSLDSGRSDGLHNVHVPGTAGGAPAP